MATFGLQAKGQKWLEEEVEDNVHVAQVKEVKEVPEILPKNLNGCYKLSDLSLDAKNQFLPLLANLSQDSVVVSEDVPLVIYWNLGKDEAKAKALFDRQKAGAMADSRFALSRDSSGTFMVVVATIKNDANAARIMASKLAATSKTIGGAWRYKSLPETYSISVKNTELLPAHSIGEINNKWRSKMTPCEN